MVYPHPLVMPSCHSELPFLLCSLTASNTFSHPSATHCLTVLYPLSQIKQLNHHIHYLSLTSIAPHSPLPVCRSACFHLWRKAYCNHNPPKEPYAYFAGTWTNQYPLLMHITKSRDLTFPQSKLKDGSILSCCCVTLNYIFTQQKSPCEYVTLSTDYRVHAVVVQLSSVNVWLAN